MKLNFKKINAAFGKPPGMGYLELPSGNGEVSIFFNEYDSQKFSSERLHKLSKELQNNEATVKWIQIINSPDTEISSALSEIWGINSLILEDIVNTEQRPKVELWDDGIFLVLKSIALNNDNELEGKQLSMIMKNGFLITVEEKGDITSEILLNRIRKKIGRIRNMKTDYLLYALFDLVIDNYFKALEQYSMKLDRIEEKIFISQNEVLLSELHNVKREIIFVKKSVWPIREIVSELQRESESILGNEMNPFLRDLHDNVIQLIDTVETMRDLSSNLFDIYLSAQSHKMNEIMKILTMISTIFIPLGFIAGFYGMNFKYMPELEIKWAYPGVVIIMISLLGLMIYFFKKKKWF
ncbi:MAG: magnesium/cobalt transporter CorA [Candidatus Cloacimonetes bacterium]|nr:magnesium/cobalt transporter CorA [Candidatus Cloacimonadota bacterium]